MAIRTRRLLGMDDELDDIYQSGTASARAQLAGVDDPADFPPSSVEFSLEETEAGLPEGADVPDVAGSVGRLGTINPWEGEPRSITLGRLSGAPERIEGAAFSQAGRFDVNNRRARQRFAPPAITGQQFDPLPERQVVDAADEIEPQQTSPQTLTIGSSATPLSTTLRGAQPGTPLLGVDTAYQERQRQQEPDGLDGIDRPASQKMRDNPYQLTKDERARLARAQRRDRNINIARTVFGGLGGLAQLGTAAAGNTGAALGIGQAMSGYEPMQDAVYQRVAGAIDQDRGQRVQAYEYDQQQAQQAAEAERNARLDDLRMRSAESNMAVDQARIAQMQQQQTRQLEEMAASGASADALRALIRSNVYSLPRNNPFAMEWLRAINDPSFANADAETLRVIDHRIGSTMSTHAFQEGRGISAPAAGGGPYLGNIPGMPAPRGASRPPQTIGEMVAQQEAARAQGQAGVPTDPIAALPPAPGRGGTRAMRAAATAATGSPAAPVAAPTPVTEGGLPDLSQYGVQVQNQGEYVSALAALERSGRRFTEEEIRSNPRIQLALATQIMASRERNAGRRSDLQRNAEDIMRTAAGENISPDEQPLYATVSTRANAVHNDVVTRFSAPMRALARAIEVRNQHEPGSREYIRLEGMIRAAIGGNGAVRSLAPLATLGSVLNRMEEDFGRGQSGAAISESEWATFRNVLNTQSFMTDPDVTLRGLRAMYDRAVNIRNSRFSEGTRPEQALRFRDNWFATRRALAGGGR